MGTSKYKGACTSEKGTWAIAVSRKKIWNNLTGAQDMAGGGN